MSKPSLKHDPLSVTAREVLALFAQDLIDVGFPDVDLHSLESAADELRALQLEAERIEAELEAARAHVAAQSSALTAQAERGLAYARVFAAANPKLAQKVAELGQGNTAHSAPAVAGKKRARARKGEGDANLFGTTIDSQSEADDALPAAAEHAA